MRGGGRHFAAIDRRDSPIAGANQDEASAADARVVAVDDAQRECRGHRGIDRVAAILHYLDTSFRRQFMSSCNYAPLSNRRLVRCSGSHATGRIHQQEDAEKSGRKGQKAEFRRSRSHRLRSWGEALRVFKGRVRSARGECETHTFALRRS